MLLINFVIVTVCTRYVFTHVEKLSHSHCKMLTNCAHVHYRKLLFVEPAIVLVTKHDMASTNTTEYGRI